MNDSSAFYYLIKRFFNYYRLPMSVINDNGNTLYHFPEYINSDILPRKIISNLLDDYKNSSDDQFIPYLINTPYDSFISIVPLPTGDHLLIGPSFSRPFSVNRVSHFINDPLSRADALVLEQIAGRLPLVDVSYLADALSLLVLLIHYREVTPQQILSANNLALIPKTLFESSHIIESEYEQFLLFEAQVQAYVQEGNDAALAKLWAEFSVSIKEDLTEYLYTEHHMMIPLLSSARQSALLGGAQKEEVISVFHSTISQISSRGSLPVNLKTVERATRDMCNLVKKNKSIPFRTDLCLKCEQYIEEHLTEKITAASLAEYCGVDRSLIFDIFRNNYDMSLTEYIQGEKMRKARLLLFHSNLSVSEIASALGFCSSSYFTKVFYSVYGIKPTEYRSSKNNIAVVR